MRVVVFLMTFGALTACGADGEPIRPSLSTTVGVGSSGTHVRTHASAGRGNWNVGVGLGL
ncbi:hypothetical protein [uncultured Roseovarius sp.]|uniref:hypothetical protein n=1 Tax=uncultured Roseovarius sp. TaxID=293344 RepID=UPI00263A2093|nr:hypothetical protein [uncultured Roseovarius sp.]